MVSSPLSWLEFHTAAPESAAKLPSSRTWRPKKATVDSSEKSQLGYPYVGSARLLAKANPNTSRWSPAPPPSAGSFGGAVNGCRAPTLPVATWVAACCITHGWVASGVGGLGAAAAAPPGATNTEASIRSTGAKYLIRCSDIG